MNTIVLGSRGSNLALWQANFIRRLLQENIDNVRVEIEVIKTRGDHIQDKPIPVIGGKGLFTKEIEDALLDERIHIAVHSLKDIPSTLPEGLVYAGSPLRADCRDTFISTRWNSLKDVPERGRIATGSMRRRALVLGQKPTLTCENLRGNIDTRLRKLEEEDWDGIIMAAAALDRLRLKHRVTEYLDPEIFVPSVGQGAIGLEVKENREDMLTALKKITHQETVDAVKAERAFMRHLEGGCSVPIGAWGRHVNGQLHLTGYFASVDGKKYIRETVYGPPEKPEALGFQLAEQFLAHGVKEFVSR